MFRILEKAEGDNGGTNEPLEAQDFIEIEQDEDDAAAPKEGEAGYVAPVIPEKKFDFTRFKTYNPDLEDDEEKAFGWLENQVKENQSLRLLAKGREVIEQDKDIITWHGHLKSDEETLFKTAEIIAGINAGETQEAATEAADAKYTRLKDANPDAITEKVRGVRASLKGFIASKEKEILTAQEAARQNITQPKVAKDVNDSAVSEVAKLDNLLGIKMSFKDQSKRDVLTGKAERAISSGELMKKLTTDPKLLAKVAFLVENEAEYVKNIKKLGGGQAKILNKMNDKNEGGVKPKPDGSSAGSAGSSKSETQKIQEARW